MNEDLETILAKAFAEMPLEGKPSGDPRDLLDLQRQFLADKSERQSLTTMSGCFALACPILPLGLLGAFFLLGKLDGFDKGPGGLEKGKTGLRAQMARMAAAEALARKRKLDAEKKGEGASTDIFPTSTSLTALISMAERRPSSWQSEKTLIPRQARMAPENGFFVTKDKMTKAKEIKKQKMLLESLMENEKSKQNFSAVSEISARLESLEKLVRGLFGHTQ